MATKRSIEETTDSAMKKPRTEGEGDELQEVRMIVDNYEASVIIGKGGSNVKKIRLDSNAFVSILKTEGSSKERVMQVKGTVDFNVAALKAIAELLINNDQERKQAENPEAVAEALCFKILIHKSLAGAIIGRGGAIIKSMQEDTGAKISVSTEPLGASTEKSVSVTGNNEQLQAAITRILTQICDNPPRPGTTSIPYVPGQPQMFAGAPQQNPYGAPPPGAYGMPPQGYGMPPQQQPYGMPMGGMAPGPMAGAPSGVTKLEKIVIPTICAGTVIGKGGSIIRDIKMQSGTTISVAAPEPTAPNDRVVSISGPPQGITTAIFLIRQRVESYQPPTGAPQMGY